MGGGGSQSSGESVSATTPGFMKELGAILNQNMTGQTGFGKQDAIADVQGVMRQQATNALQESMPNIASMQNTAGAYSSTTKDLMKNDLQARIVGQLAATQSQAIKDYAAIDADRIRAFAAATQAGTSSAMTHWESSESRNKSPWGGLLDDLGRGIIGGGLDIIAGPGDKKAGEVIQMRDNSFQNGGRVPHMTDAEKALAKMLADFNQLDNAAQAGLVEKKWAEDAKKGKMEFLDGSKKPTGPKVKPEEDLPPGKVMPIPTQIPESKKTTQPKSKFMVKSDDDDLSGLFARLGNV